MRLGGEREEETILRRSTHITSVAVVGATVAMWQNTYIFLVGLYESKGMHRIIFEKHVLVQELSLPKENLCHVMSTGCVMCSTSGVEISTTVKMCVFI